MVNNSVAGTFLILISYCLTSTSASSQNPQDVTLILKATKTPAVYNIGESIRIQLSFSSDAGNYCFSGGSANRGWAMTHESFIVAPLDNPSALGEGTQDPEFDESPFAFIRGGSVLQSIPHRLSTFPEVVSGDLNQWIRFTKPGRYVVTARSDRVRASESCGIWDGKEPRAAPANITIQSNQEELTILPVDPQWELRELHEIRQALDSSGAWFQGSLSQSADDSSMICFEGDCSMGGRIGLARRLRYLNTQDATAELAKRFLATEAEDSYQGELSRGLLDSPWRDTAIAVLEGALRNPEMRIPPTIPGGAPPMICRLLAEMLVAREFQDRPLPARPPQYDPQVEDSRRLAAQPWRDRFDAIVAELQAIRPAVH